MHKPCCDKGGIIMSNHMIVNEKDWDIASEEQRSWMVFNTIQSINTRLEKLEKRPIIDKALSLMGGIIGGALAYIGIKII